MGLAMVGQPLPFFIIPLRLSRRQIAGQAGTVPAGQSNGTIIPAHGVSPARRDGLVVGDEKHPKYWLG